MNPTAPIPASINPSQLGSDLDLSSNSFRPRVLIVDDDADYVAMLKLILRSANFDVSGVADHNNAVQKCLELDPHVILLDVMMPGQDGYDTFRSLQAVSRAAVIFVSAAERADNLAQALELGAEDYLSKPFDQAELIARIRKAFRHTRSGGGAGRLSHPGIGLVIDLAGRSATLHGKPLHLMPREFELLTILAEAAPKNVAYETIAMRIWGAYGTPQRAHLKTIAFALRRKLEVDPAKPSLLVNNRNLGYQLILTQ